MKEKLVVIVSACIFGMIVILAGASSDWGVTLLSGFVGDVFHFSK